MLVCFSFIYMYLACLSQSITVQNVLLWATYTKQLKTRTPNSTAAGDRQRQPDVLVCFKISEYTTWYIKDVCACILNMYRELDFVVSAIVSLEKGKKISFHGVTLAGSFVEK